MQLRKIVHAAALAACTAGIIVYAGMLLVSNRVHADDQSESDATLAAIGLKIAPPFINTKGKDPTLVGLREVGIAPASCALTIRSGKLITVPRLASLLTPDL